MEYGFNPKINGHDQLPLLEGREVSLHHYINSTGFMAKAIRLVRYVYEILKRRIFGDRKRDDDFAPYNCDPSGVNKTSLFREIGFGISAILGSKPSVRDFSAFIATKTLYPNNDYRKLLDRNFKELTVCRETKNHSHPLSARIRSSVNRTLKRIVQNIGLEPYQMSASINDVEDSDATRYYYDTKDLKIPHKDDIVTKNHVIIYCDVDYHCDINAHLKYSRPMAIYGFVPKQTTKTTNEYHYYVTEDNKFHYAVRGGAQYEHEIWDYRGDCVTAIDNNNDLVLFDIVQKEFSEEHDHRVIFLTPAVKLPYPYWLPYYNPDQIGIQRRKLISNDLACIIEPGSNTISISRPGRIHGISMPLDAYHTVQAKKQQAELIGRNIDVATVERLLNVARVPDPARVATYLIGFLDIDTSDKRLHVISTNSIDVSYQTIKPFVHDDGKDVKAHVLCNPLVTNPDVYPCKSTNNEYSSIKGRVIDVRNLLWPKAVYETYAREFIGLVVPRTLKGTGVPWELHQVEELQKRPAQRQRTEQARLVLTDDLAYNRLQTFCKTEPSQLNDPRNITTMHASTTVMLSRFSYAFKHEVAKTIHWFGPSLDPRETAEKLAIIVQDGAIVTDFTRMDGTVSKFLQSMIVFPAYMLYFNQRGDKQKLETLLKSVFIDKAHTPSGFRYEPGWSVRSGSPITTEGNTLVNAFVCFCALRKLGNNVEQSWLNMGLYYGDDGVHRNIPNLAGALKTVSRELGMTMEVAVIPKHGMIPYLGRIFVDPLTTLDSFQDPLRFLPKIHLSINNEVTLQQAIYNKFSSYKITDPHTPLLSQLCDAQISKTDVKIPTRLLNEEHWRMMNAWPQEDPWAIKNAFASYMKRTVAEIDILAEQITTARTNLHYPILLDNNRKVKVDSVLGGEIYYVDARIVYRDAENTKCIEKVAREEMFITEKKQECKRTPNNSNSRTKTGKSKRENRSTRKSTTSQTKREATAERVSQKQPPNNRRLTK